MRQPTASAESGAVSRGRGEGEGCSIPRAGSLHRKSRLHTRQMTLLFYFIFN